MAEPPKMVRIVSKEELSLRESQVKADSMNMVVWIALFVVAILAALCAATGSLQR